MKNTPENRAALEHFITTGGINMNTTNLSNQDFDLPAFLLGEIYGNMDADDIAGWCLSAAEDIAHDLLLDDIEADTQEIYEIIAEFISQDAEEAQL
ncbi:MAG: hypothetical protein ACOX6G_10830 [Christensenellales bacterium]|jgi:hypothetical protein